jgi:tetratricopeptide (TPR) repeat protein
MVVLPCIFCVHSYFILFAVHKLALTDLGRAIALDPTKPENYFLRADCQSKLGNYEQALADLSVASDYGYRDMFSLLCARGVVHRLLGHSDLALQDFNEAMKSIDLTDRAAIVRITTLSALCMIDLHQFSESCDLLSKCLEHVRVFIDEACEQISAQANIALQQANAQAHSHGHAHGSSSSGNNNNNNSSLSLQIGSPSSKGMNKQLLLSKGMSFRSAHINAHPQGRHSPDVYSIMTSTGRLGNTSPTNTRQSPLQQDKQSNSSPTNINAAPVEPPMSITASRKLEWILLYHQALCLYNQGFHEHVENVLCICLHPTNSVYAPDDHSVSKVQFYLALSLIHLSKHEVAEQLLQECIESSWAANDQTQSLCWFVWGKLKQKLLQHRTAIEYFTNSIQHDNDGTHLNVHAYFRRAWSYKALHMYAEAGQDFEIAKNARPDDPNFAVNYKNISRLEYMQIDSEPDIVLLFPPLLPNNI